jgi:predicted dienelactone hydrolase
MCADAAATSIPRAELGGSTPLALAQATCSANDMQQQCVQQSRAFVHPHRWFSQGNRSRNGSYRQSNSGVGSAGQLAYRYPSSVANATSANPNGWCRSRAGITPDCWPMEFECLGATSSWQRGEPQNPASTGRPPETLGKKNGRAVNGPPVRRITLWRSSHRQPVNQAARKSKMSCTVIPPTPLKSARGAALNQPDRKSKMSCTFSDPEQL